MKYLAILLMLFPLLGCQNSPERKWYDRVLDSLGRIEAPLTIDTTLFIRQLNGMETRDTTINDILIRQSRNYWDHNFVRFSWHKDSLIANKHTYDGSDGKLISWSRHFVGNGNYIDDGSIVDYTKWYKKNGAIKIFGAGELGYEPSPWQNYTIYHLLELLKAEGIDIKNNVDIGRLYTDPPTILNFGEISYPKLNWVVKVYYYDDSRRNYASIFCREFDADTGEVIKEWWDSAGIE
jgi:hypothetical protein